MSNNKESTSIESFAEDAYLAYAMKTVKDRAIPDVEDGLKPVQRRILYSMYQLKLLPRNAKPMKCARVVGDTIGKLHPHGDSAVYEAMVRMAQPFSLRYPLVHGEGNFGSRDGDGAAAMRYTEARLAPISAALLDELSWDTVDFKPNYDNVLLEPVMLPARLPFLLLNGASGIAVGMATNLLSHNLNEVVDAVKLVINKPKTNLDEIMAVMPGPDFPTGSRLVSPASEIRSAYETGRGSVRLRSTWHVEHYGKGNKDWRLVVTELPQDTSTAKIMVAIDALIDPKPREKDGKKLPLTQDQLRLKKMFGDLIDEVRDSSDVSNPVRLTIEPKDRKSDPEALAMALCAYTDMEMTVSPNFVCVDRDGNPRQSGLMDWLRQWCDFRIDTVRRRCVDEKKRVDARLHILNGRLSILSMIDKVIKIIKDSSDPKKDLIDKFGLDEIQADDVLDMRLRQLANLEKTKIEAEHAELMLEQKRLSGILSDDKTLRKIVVKELDADAKLFGDARRTKLEPSEPAAKTSASSSPEMTALLAPEPVAVALTERGWISWRPAKSLEEARSLDYKVKQGDAVKRVYFGDRAHQLLLVGISGRGYAIRLTDLPSKSDTAPLNQFFDLQSDEKLVEAVIAKPDDKFLVAGSEGYGFIVKASDWMNRMKAGKAFITLQKDEEPLPPIPLDGYNEETAKVMALSTDGRAVGFPLKDVKMIPKGKGVGLIGLAPGHKLSDLVVLNDNEQLLLSKSTKPINPQDWLTFIGSRSAGKKGKSLHKSSQGAVFVRAGRVSWVPPADKAEV